MKTNHEIVDKVQRIFDEGWERVRRGAIPSCVNPDDIMGGMSREEWVWTVYMNNHDVIVITRDDLLDSFADMVNFGASLKDSVCLLNPAQEEEFLLVPNPLVEKCVALGALA